MNKLSGLLLIFLVFILFSSLFCSAQLEYISKEEFPLIFSDGSYHIRYKVVAENKAISSDWSDVYQIFLEKILMDFGK